MSFGLLAAGGPKHPDHPWVGSGHEFRWVMDQTKDSTLVFVCHQDVRLMCYFHMSLTEVTEQVFSVLTGC